MMVLGKLSTQGLRLTVGAFIALGATPYPAQAQRLPQDLGASPWALPAVYHRRLLENPAFFSLEDGWKHRTFVSGQGASSLTGTLPVVMVLGLFADSPEPHVTPGTLQAAMFDGPSEYGTVTEYYDEVSGGRFTVDGTTLPWVRTDLTMAQVVGTEYGLGNDSRTGEFLFKTLAGADPEFDFGRFDNDGPDGVPNSGDDDGSVDAVAFQFLEVSASCGGPAIWPHRSRLQYWNSEQVPFVTDDPRSGGGFIVVNDYTVQSAVDCGGTDVQKAQTMAHELGHVIGLPDLYDRSQGLLPEERRWVVGCWSLMAAGSWGCGTSNREAWLRPTHMGPWEKSVLGWLGELTEVEPGLDQEFVLGPVRSTQRVLKIPLQTDGPVGDREYLLVEYRTQEGFDADIPASGVLVYHVDPKVSGNRPCDTCPQVYRVEILEADGNNSLRLNFLQGGNRGEPGDAWGWNGPGRLTRNTYPSTRLTSGAASPVTIYDISVAEGLATVRLSSKEVHRTTMADALFGVGGRSLTAEELAYLDGMGNGNGQFDVGDLRAYLHR